MASSGCTATRSGPSRSRSAGGGCCPVTGDRGSYGHRHPGQEEVYFVISGTVTFKVGDDVFQVGPQAAVRMTGQAFYSVHNDTEGEVELLIFSPRLAHPPTETDEGFWP